MDGSSGYQRSADRDAALGALLREVARAANEADLLVDAARTALAAVCRMTGRPVGHLLVPAPDGDDFVSSGVWHVDGPRRFDTLRRLTDPARFAPGVGWIGRVRPPAGRRGSSDLRDDPMFPRHPDGSDGPDLGVASAFAFPVCGARGVVAVLEFFFRYRPSRTTGCSAC